MVESPTLLTGLMVSTGEACREHRRARWIAEYFAVQDELRIEIILESYNKGKLSDHDAGKSLAEIHRNGTRPSIDQCFDQWTQFWSLVLNYAEDVRNISLFETALCELTGAFGQNPFYTHWLEEKGDVLAVMKIGR